MTSLLAEVLPLSTVILVLIVATIQDYGFGVVLSRVRKHTNLESFRSHVYRKHRDELHLDPRETSRPENTREEFLTNSDHPLGDEICEQSSIVDQVRRLRSSAAKFLLKAKEDYKLSQASVDRIVSSMRGL